MAQIFQKKNNPTAAKAMGMGMKITFIILPVFSLWIGFSYPAGLGLYWCYSSLFALVQTIILNIAYSPAKVAAIVEEEREKNKKSGKKTFMERMAEQQLEREGKYTFDFGTDNIGRMDNVLDKLKDKCKDKVARCAECKQAIEDINENLGKPFPKEQEFVKKTARLAQLNAELDTKGKKDEMGGLESELGDNLTQGNKPKR